MKHLSLFFILFFIAIKFSLAQSLQDNFSDGDFTTNPTWSGTNADFIVNGSNQLQTNNLGFADTSYLSTSVSIQDSVFWEFFVRMNFAPSATNRAQIYLQSDNPTLGLTTNGYYLKIGMNGSTDSLEIFRVTSGVATKVFGGPASAVATNPIVSIRIIRNSVGVWDVFADYTGGTTYVSQGSFTDATHTTGTYFGFWAKYTATNGDKFFFDNVYVSPMITDVTAPAIDSVVAISATQVDVYFDENVDLTTANNFNNYTIDNGVSVSNAARDGSNFKLVHLTTSTLTSALLYTLTVNGVEDLNNNAINNGTDNFTYYNIQPAAFQDIIFNEIHADPTPVVGLPDAEFVELLNRSNKIINLNGLVFNDGTAKVLPNYLLFPDSMVILTLSTNLPLFTNISNKIGLSSLALTNSGELLSLKNGTTTIDSVLYDLAWYQDAVKDDGGWTLELINPNVLCLGAANWIASNAVAGGTPGQQNSVYNNTPDTQGPSLLNANFIDNITIELTFDENLTAATASVIGNYNIAGLTISNAAFTAPSTVTLTVSPMVDQTNYTVVVSNLTDCSGNAIGVNNTDNFTYINVQTPAFQDIIITEIHADPSPVVGLPDAEFVELFNRSNKTINLGGMILNDGSNHVLPSHILAPNAYVILTSTAYVTAYSSFGTTLDVGTLTLTNSGELIQLRDNNGSTVDSVLYDITWYQDAVKDDGGWTLELINPVVLCRGAANWIASNAVAGGTPGQQNSVFSNSPDLQGPSLVSANFVDNVTIVLVFDENLTAATASVIGNYNIAGLTISNAVFTAPSTVTLTVSPMVDQTNYTVVVSNLTDCSGNAIGVNNTDNFTYVDVQTPAFQDIIITEIHADPSPVVGLPDAEFVELFNRSNKTINLGGMILNDGSNHVLPSHILAPNAYVILTSTAYVSAYSSFGTTLDIGTLTLTNSGELIQLRDNNGSTIDSVLYDITWYQDAVKDDGGWTLELINPVVLCRGAANWIASNAVAGGTPGQQNSVFSNSPDLQGPSLVSANFVDNVTIVLVFDENLTAATASVIGNYNIAGLTISNAVFTAPSTVTLTVSPMVDQTNYTVAVSNLTDCSGNAIGVNNTDNFTYVDVQAPAFQDIIITEIHADPSPVVGLPDAEFVELFNRSNKTINLGGMILNDGSNHVLPSHILAPNAYVILTSTAYVTAYSSFGTTLDIGTLTLTNSGELIQLRDNNGSTVDSVLYDITWYQDAVKDDGGWTLELINPVVLCRGAANWIASNAVAGGTPGQQNSVFSNSPDLQGPSLVSANFVDNVTIVLVFDENLTAATASVIGNYNIAGLTISNAVFTAPSTVTLTVSPMVDQTNYTVVVSNLTDCSGNAIGVNNTDNFTYVDVQAPAFQDIIITEIHADPSPVVGLPDAEFVELFNRSNKTINLGGMILNDGSNHVLPSHILAPNAYVILTSTAYVTAYSSFGTTLDIGTLTLTNSGELIQLRDNNGSTVDSVLYDITWYQDAVKDDGGWTLELINPVVLCRGAANWIASNAVAGGTPGQQNSVFSNSPDLQGPSLVSANFTDGTHIELIFDEALGTNANLVGNYTVTNATVNSVTFIPPTTVVLTLTANMIDQNNYTITVSNLTDCSGNIITSNNIDSFIYYEIQMAGFQELIITEIFADPTPQIGLPDAEFIEIHNRSNKTINLLNYALFESTTHTLPNQTMLPGSYAIICAAANASLFAGFGTVVPINSLSLTNSGELLLLYNSNGVLLDSLEYSDTWYQDAVKDDGGWTLELINPNLLCKGASNWIASNHSSGGSPGIQNSVYSNVPDNTPPSIVLARQSGTNQIQIEFDDILNPLVAGNIANYSVSGMTVNGVIILSSTEVLLTLTTNMIDQTVYTITVNNLEDCVGNIATILTTTMTYYESGLAEHYDLIINEIMSDPNPSVGLPEKEYIEIYNRSNKTFNLEGFTLQDGSSVVAVLPFFILQPGDYLTIYSSNDTIGFASFGKVLPVSPFPDFNTSDIVILRDQMGEVIDAVSYELSWYQNADKDDGGWSIERINPNRPCEAATNWRASENLLGGTPSTANSVLNTDADTQAPDALRAFPLSADSVRVYFSEAIADSAGAVAAHYTINNGINVLSARLEMPFYNSVVLLLDQPLVLGTTYLITMNVGLTDCIGNPIALRNTARVALPQDIQSGDLILNEVLFNPVTSGSDFIELYNTSNKVLNTADLVISNAEIIGGNLANASSLQTRPITVDWLVFPNEYVVITEDADQVRSQYSTPNPENFVENDVPTFDDKEGHVFLYAAYDSAYIDPFGNPQTAYLAKILDLFDYQESFHSPLIDDKNGVSLERIDFDAPTNDHNNWHSAATEVGYATPAYLNSSFVINNIDGSDLIQLPTDVVSPDGDGYQDFLLINYNIDALGYVANIDIYDATGLLIKNLVNSEMLMTEGSLQWDGTDNEGRKARVGIHILAIEIFDDKGNVQRFKKTCVVAGRMN